MNSAMHSVFLATLSASLHSRRIARRGLRYTTLVLAVAGTMPAWSQGTVNGQRGDLGQAAMPFDGRIDALGNVGNGIDLPALDGGNSNLPPTSPRVLPARVGGAD